MLRSSFVSLFWQAMQAAGHKLQFLADALRVDKSAVSRWFSSNPPNWTIDTIADIANALDLEIMITARQRSAPQTTITSSGIQVMTTERPSGRNFTEEPFDTDPPVQSRIVRKPSDIGSPVETTAG